MAEIKPFRAWRYAPTVPYPIRSLVSPLFDVVSEKQRATLYKHPCNSIHLSSPPEYGNSSEKVAQHLKKWKNDKTIVQDDLPGIYVYYQYFRLPGSKKIGCRKGFSVYIRTYDWEDNVVLRHENTMPHAVRDQADLLAKTKLHVSATHGLYTDYDFLLEKWMDEAILSPMYEVESDQGVKNVIAVIHDKKVIDKFVETIRDKKILLADGHHRYQGSINHRKRQETLNPNHKGDEAYNFHLTYLSNAASSDLHILPTHRLVMELNGLSKKNMLDRLTHFFHLNPIKDTNVIPDTIPKKPHTFGVLFKGEAYTIQLKPEWHNKVDWDIPDVVKQLDITTLHYFVFEKIFKIPREAPGFFEKVKFEHSFSECLDKVNSGQGDMAIIMQEIPIEVIKMVCESGFVMPQKSTYFYPKLICGFFFGSIQEDEFQTFPAAGFK